MFWKKYLPLTIAFVFGIVGIAIFYIPHSISDQVNTNLAKWFTIISGFAMVLGIVSLIELHYYKIKRKKEGWGYSIFVMIGFFVSMILSFYNSGLGLFAIRSETGQIEWVYNAIVNPAMSAMFAMLAFFVASSAFRTFRAKSVEAAILLVSAAIVMLGRVPIGALISDSIPDMANWLLSTPNMAVKRALFFGICLGSIATSLRIIFGIERSYLGGGE